MGKRRTHTGDLEAAQSEKSALWDKHIILAIDGAQQQYSKGKRDVF